MLQILSGFVPNLSRIADVPGNDGKFAVEECFPEVERFIVDGKKLCLFLGATGCGKSKVLPEEIAKQLSKHSHWSKLLVLTTAAKDVEDMNKKCKQPSHYRTGAGQGGDSDWTSAHVVFATVGLASRWYAGSGLNAFGDFGAVLLDEFGSVERDVEYSFIFEVMLEIQARHEKKGWPFPIFMCTATMSDRLADTVDQMHPTRIECPKRPFPLERYQVDMESLSALYDAMATCAAKLFLSDKTVLVFLPGQAEISSLQELLASKGAGSKIF
jgi:hypothetical protein